MSSLTTTANRKRRLSEQQVNMLENTMRFHWTHAFYLEKRNEWFASAEYQKAPHWVRSYLSGIEFGMMRVLWGQVVYSYVVHGKRLTIESSEYRSISPQYISEQCADTGAYVWRDATDKLWTLPSEKAEPIVI